MKPTLNFHEIMIVNNTRHDASFVRVLQNKVAFSTRGCNPMNRNVLGLPESIRPAINDDREEDAMVSYIERSGQSTIVDLT